MVEGTRKRIDPNTRAFSRRPRYAYARCVSRSDIAHIEGLRHTCKRARARANEKEHTHVRDAARLYIHTYVNTHLRMRQETSCANRSGSAVIRFFSLPTDVKKRGRDAVNSSKIGRGKENFRPTKWEELCVMINRVDCVRWKNMRIHAFRN